MAAFLTDRLLSPRADSTAPAFFLPTPGARRRRSIDLSETFSMLRRAASEGVMLLWMLAVVAFFFLLGAGAAGFLD